MIIMHNDNICLLKLKLKEYYAIKSGEYRILGNKMYIYTWIVKIK